MGKALEFQEGDAYGYPGRVALFFEFDQRMIHELKRRGGRWDPNQKLWHVPEETSEIVLRHAERLGYRIF